MPKPTTKSKLLKSFDALLAAGQNSTDFDDDEDVGDGTRAALGSDDSGQSDQDSYDEVQKRSGLRAKTAPRLSELDPRYKGKKTSRRDIEKERKGDMDEREHASAELGFMFEGGGSDDDEDDDVEEEEEEVSGSEKGTTETFSLRYNPMGQMGTS